MNALDRMQLFIHNAITTHGNKYNYSQIQYVNRHTSVILLCNSCNNYFKQIPAFHTRLLHPSGCPYCNSHQGTEGDRLNRMQQFITNSSIDVSLYPEL